MSAETDRRTVRVRVTGRVQGVFFRAWTEEEARALGLDGWVRNRTDGSVEAVLSGAPETVQDMLGRMLSGPPHARVDDMTVREEPAVPAAGFETRPTG